MARMIPNKFTAWELTDTEALQAAVFTISQLQVLQNHLSSIAEEKLLLNYTPKEHDKFVQQSAYLTGQIDIIQHLIDTSAVSADELSNPT